MHTHNKPDPAFKKKRIKLSDVTHLSAIFRGSGLNTVCEGAKCPNIGECFAKKIATFLIAGPVCTRSCRFCAIAKGNPRPLDNDEPHRVACAVRDLGLRYAVVTSVTRDDIPDGGADHFFRTVTQIRKLSELAKIEILVPDFKGHIPSVQRAVASRPDVFSHNLETVPRLYAGAREGADYLRSLKVLEQAKEQGLRTKSGIMLGMGEKEEEVLQVMRDLRSIGCDFLTLGQYLAPSKKHLPVYEHIPVKTFEYFKTTSINMGFSHCSSGTYVRSSYMADNVLIHLKQ